MGDLLCLDTDKVGWHDRDIPYKILLWYGPLLQLGGKIINEIEIVDE